MVLQSRRHSKDWILTLLCFDLFSCLGLLLILVIWMCVQVIKDHGNLVDKKRIFISDLKDENPLDCLVRKVNIVQISPDVSTLCSSFAV